MVAVMDGYVRLVHSVHIYTGHLFRPSTFDDKIVGFVGDRADGVDPSAVILTEANFDWLDLDVVTSEMEMVTFFAAPENRGKLFVPGATSTTAKVNLLKLLIIPGGLVPWILDRPRTPMELHARLLEVLAPNPDERGEEVELALLWCRVASHASDEHDGISALATVVSPACPDSPAVRKWLKDRIATTLGSEPEAPPQQQHVVYQHYPAHPSPFQQGQATHNPADQYSRGPQLQRVP